MIKQFLVTFEVEDYNGETLEEMFHRDYANDATLISDEVIDFDGHDTERVTARDIEKVFG